jgi:hypothetical protein
MIRPSYVPMVEGIVTPTAVDTLRYSTEGESTRILTIKEGPYRFTQNQLQSSHLSYHMNWTVIDIAVDMC